eukprot:CAMPEP_0115683278 /NCGR_PEP_ID=MMETSP0272-20121206/58302_1 /TAXON_ID=71861 /ORGANISM="Scrippsiella trochoidea, Strain CCMP3099" /LENGTH=47 /DNA_ID= /DNA_START= /DNA_END= /DNA_ORIENTATION=
MDNTGASLTFDNEGFPIPFVVPLRENLAGIHGDVIACVCPQQNLIAI